MYFLIILLQCLLLIPTIDAHKKNPDVWKKEIYWNLSSKQLADNVFWPSLHLPQNFVVGVATSAFQLEGAQTANNRFVENNWTKAFPKRYAGNPGCDHWNRWQEDVAHIKDLGITDYRLSIPWDKIEEEEGVINEDALAHYVNLCVALKNEGIEPWICLHHFTEPVWFGEKEGIREEKNGKKYHTGRYGFESEENIKYFVRFCVTVFERLNGIVKFWATFNEPVAYAMEGWARGVFPPCKKAFPITSLASVVLKNMLTAHVQMYEHCKKINPKAQIGIIHMFHPLEPNNQWNPVEVMNAKMGNYLVHDIVLNFFKTGTYNWFYMVTDYNPHARHSLDFIGVNYYRHEMVKYNGKTVKARPGEEIVKDTQVAIYPEGLYRCIQKASILNLPIYVTEFGIPDESDTQRNDFIKKHLYAIQKALDNGYDVRGCFYWTLMDCLGWHDCYNKKYGLYEVRGSEKERVLRKGSRPWVNFLRLQELKRNQA